MKLLNLKKLFEIYLTQGRERITEDEVKKLFEECGEEWDKGTDGLWHMRKPGRAEI